MNSGEISVGTPVIVHPCDRPCTRLVAVVSRVGQEWHEARYLTTAVPLRTTKFREGEATPLAAFSVTLTRTGEYVVGVVTGPSSAKERDGTQRHWHPECEESWPVDEESWRLLTHQDRN